MKYFVFLTSGLVLFGATAFAQDAAEAAEAATESSAVAEAAPAEPAASEPKPEAPKEEEKKRSAYYKKVKGWLWIEGFLGPTSYDPDKFGSLSLAGVPNAPRVKGLEGGFSAFLGLGGFEIGGFYRQADYTQYKLMKVGLEIQGTFRFIPYVHPIVRMDIGFAKMFQKELKIRSTAQPHAGSSVYLPRQPVRAHKQRLGRNRAHWWRRSEGSDHPLDVVCRDFRLEFRGLVDARGCSWQHDKVPVLDPRSAVWRDLCPHVSLHRRARGLALTRLVHVVD